MSTLENINYILSFAICEAEYELGECVSLDANHCQIPTYNSPRRLGFYNYITDCFLRLRYDLDDI